MAGSGRQRSMPDALRRRVLRRDRGICYVCGKPGADQVDHVLPVMDGGTDDESNLGAIHARPCHVRKTRSEQRRYAQRRRPTLLHTERHPGAYPSV